MGPGLNLATAFVNIVPSLRGIRGTLTKSLQGEAGVAGDRAGDTAGRSLTSRLGRVAKTGAAVAGGVAATALGYALTRGFQRLSAIEAAEAKLRGLGNSAGDVKVIMDGALKAVQGTAFGMDAAATAAAGAVAAGIKPGAELNAVLKSMANSAAAAGIGMEEMGGIYNKVASIGKAQNDSLRQVAERGIPIYKTLAGQLGVTEDAVFKLASKGKINFEMFEKAMTAASGTVADEMGKTTVGTFQNLDAAMSRLGAGLLGGVFPHIQPLFQSLIGVVDRLTVATGPLSEAIGAHLGGAIAALSGWLDGLDFTSFEGFLSSLAVGGAESSLVMDLLAGAMQVLGGVISWVADNAGLAAGIFVGLLGVMALMRGATAAQNTLFAVQAPLLAYSNTLRLIAAHVEMQNFRAKTAATLAQNSQNLATIRGSVATNTATASTLRQTVATRAQTIATRSQAVAQRVLNVAMRAAPWMLLLAAVAAVAVGLHQFFTKTEEGQALWTQFTTELTDAFAPVQAQLAELMPVFSDLMGVVAELGGQILGQLVGALSELLPVVLGLVASLVSQLLPVAMQLIAAVFPVLAQVITAVVRAVVPLVSLLASILVPILRLVGTVLTWLIGHIATGVTALVQVIGGLISGDFAGGNLAQDGPVIGFFQTLRTIAGQVVSWFVGTAWPFLQTVFAGIGTVAMWLWRNAIMPAFNGIRLAISVAVMVVTAIFRALTAFVRGVLAPIFMFLWSVVRSAFQFIRSFIQVSWAIVKIVFQAIVSFIRSVLGPIFTWLYNNIVKPVWDAIKWVISTAWSGIKIVFDAIVSFLKVTLGPIFQWLYNNIIRPVWDNISSKISDTWSWIKTNVFDPLSKAVKETLPKAFETGKDAIGRAWKKLEDVAKAPVKFVIQTIVNDGIISGWNKIANKFGADEVDKIKLPKGFARGGWTGAGARLQPAGIVHADEFVVKKSSRRRFERQNPGVLDHINRTGMLPMMGGYAGGGMVWNNLWGIVKNQFPGVRLHSSYRPGARTASGNSSYHSRGMAIDITPDMNIFNWLHDNFGQSNELIFSPANGRQIKNGRHHYYTGAVRKMHFNHIHWANRTRFGGPTAGADGAEGEGFDLLGSLLSPFNALKEKVSSGVGDSAFGKMIGSGAKKIVQMPIEWIKDNISKVADFVTDTWQGAKETVQVGTTKAQAKAWAIANDIPWGGARMSALKWIIQRESNWNPRAQNPRSTASGLAQMINSTSRAYAGSAPLKSLSVWKQLDAMMKYVNDRYGGAVPAKKFWERNNYYDTGGRVASVGASFPTVMIPPPDSLIRSMPAPHLFDGGGWLTDRMVAVHGKRQPDAVLSSQQWSDMHQIAMSADGTSGGTTINISITGVDQNSADEVAGALRYELARTFRGGRYALGTN